MAVCPACNARVPLKLVLKTTDVLLFPDEGAKQCPACDTKLVPTIKSVVACALALLALAAPLVLWIYRASGSLGFGPGFLAGLASGLGISLSVPLLSAMLLRFRI